jgi:hypothetical protein
VFVASAIRDQMLIILSDTVPVMSFAREYNLYALQAVVPQSVTLFLFPIKPESLYTELHRVTGHGGELNQRWHRVKTV